MIPIWYVYASFALILISILVVLVKILNVLRQMNGGEPTKEETIQLHFKDIKQK